MSKENMAGFLEKAASDQALAEKLRALQKQYFAQLVELAGENGFKLVPEDFAEEIQELSDDEAAKMVSGGFPSISVWIGEFYRAERNGGNGMFI